METSQNLDFEEFKKTITPQFLLISRILYTAMALGVCVFLAIVLFLFYTQQHQNEKPAITEGFLKALSLVHVLFLPACYAASAFFFRIQTNPVNLSKMKSAFGALQAGQNSTAEQRYLGIVFTAYMFRAAAFEAPAIFGITICMVAGLQGHIQQYPIYWLNLGSFVIMMIATILTFPSRAKLEDLFKNRCIPKPAHVC